MITQQQYNEALEYDAKIKAVKVADKHIAFIKHHIQNAKRKEETGMAIRATDALYEDIAKSVIYAMSTDKDTLPPPDTLVSWVKDDKMHYRDIARKIRILTDDNYYVALVQKGEKIAENLTK